MVPLEFAQRHLRLQDDGVDGVMVSRSPLFTAVDAVGWSNHVRRVDDTVTELFDAVEDAVADIAAGKLVIVTDDENRENEGDLIMAASKVTPETVNMMICDGSGIVCVPMLDPQLRRLGLGSMVAQNREVQRTDF